MISAIGGTTVALMTVVILIAGTTNGLAGFGFALVGTMALATAIDPATAVVFMIVPIFAVNLSLVRDLSKSSEPVVAGSVPPSAQRWSAPLSGWLSSITSRPLHYVSISDY